MNFYSEKEINTIKSELKAGLKPTAIARKYSKEWGRTINAILFKILMISKNPKAKTVKRGRPVGSKTTKPNNGAGIVLSSGFVFDFKPHRAEMHSDHVRLYF